MSKPLLSIGIIFKNEIRSLEHCLKALQPLRDALPCQLLMADTGSTDGCREIAERYADVLIDFPWIDDFSAARNAVIDRAEGEWYLVVDDDEYLDEDLKPVLDFFNGSIPKELVACMVTQRNYFTYEMDRSYSDFLTYRLFRMSSGIRYTGAIHEYLTIDASMITAMIPQIVLNHDGYVRLDPEAAEKKRERNLTAIRKELEKDPKNLRRLLQYIESGMNEPDLLERLYYTVDLIESKHTGWEHYGPSLMRYAVNMARTRKLPEYEKWLAEAEELFPDSFFTRIDIEAYGMIEAFDRKEYAECVRRGECLVQAYADFKALKGAVRERTTSTFTMADDRSMQSMRILLAKAYLEEDQPEQTAECLRHVDCTVLEEADTTNLTQCLMELQERSDVDTSDVVLHCWRGINEPVPHEERAALRHDLFLKAASSFFNANFRQEREKKDGYRRPAYTALLPLADECDMGVGAALMQASDPEEVQALLGKVRKWNELPTTSFLRALRYCSRFPLPGKPLKIEEMDDLAKRMSGDPEDIRKMAVRYEPSDWQSLNWSRALLLAAVRAWSWKKGDAEKSMELARAFARLEKALLPRYYSQEILLEENISALPPLHRFGWHLVRAFDALDSGDAAGYARSLRNGLQANKGMKPMVEFLMDHTEALTPSGEQAQITDELSALAGQIRSILANYSPDDPAVLQIKSTPAYQKVAWMIEAPSFGTLPQ